ncbi:iron chelate uptake ABC transporter family permease subunit, partial [Mycobacterium tuberculosis]|nr:iron chelate uptake ABC transporter family permease subunit [Mycobacterium tuberculosis]
ARRPWRRGRWRRQHRCQPVIAIIAVTLLAGAATAAAGPIGFIGLMIPHIARWIVGPDQRWILSDSLILSPLLLLGPGTRGRLVT